MADFQVILKAGSMFFWCVNENFLFSFLVCKPTDIFKDILIEFWDNIIFNSYNVDKKLIWMWKFYTTFKTCNDVFQRKHTALEVLEIWSYILLLQSIRVTKVQRLCEVRWNLAENCKLDALSRCFAPHLNRTHI